MGLRRPRVESRQLLDRLGYSYYSFRQEGEKPEFSEKTFTDILPDLSRARSEKSRNLLGKRLYRHQLEAYEALKAGKNLILRSGTGSGKTEAWFLHAAESKLRTLAVYPTLALAYDQLQRLSQYCGDLGLRIMALDASRRQELVSKHGSRTVRRMLTESHIVLTNPAFLLNEVKKLALKGYPLLSGFFEKVDLIVVDDFDFYGPREIALLFSMLETLIKATGRRVQLAFMTAALANPEEVADHLTRLNGRETEIVSGKAFRAANEVYVVLGKNLRKFWDEARGNEERLREAGVGEDVLKALRSFEDFKQNFYKVWDALRYAGTPAPEPWPDPAEMISEYVFDDAVTLVFTRSIARAEEIARRVIERTGRRERVASHHHLISKEVRREVEDAVKAGLVKVLISPRTLSQGIDIGEVQRVVHIGLPDNVREFYQREGRKGRRPETEQTETIIIPQGAWDGDLLSRGAKTVEKWLNLPLEKIVVNPGNKYSTLFSALLKLQSPPLRKELSEDEVELLRALGLEKNLELTGAGKRAWRQMGFYEFAPPYGIKRMKIEEDGSAVRLEDISHCDLVEKFQPGSIDYTSDGVVTYHRLGGGGRVVTAVFVEPLRERTLRRYEGTAYALEEYERLKRSWGEAPNIWRDYHLGRLHSRVFCVVHPPSEGFGRYTKIPNRVEWVVIGERKKMMRRGDETIFYRDRRVLVVPAPTYGKYEDYTYGIIVEVDIGEDPELLRLGLAYTMIVLRRVFGIAFETIMYDILRLGERKFIALHEPESAGLLEKLDWSEVYRAAERYEPDELDDIFLEEIDEYAYSTFTARGLDWKIAREYGLRALDYLRRREKIILEFMGMGVEIPKPSRSLGLASISAVYLPLREDLNAGIYALSVYDGEEHVYASGTTELGRPDRGYSAVQEKLSHLLDQGFKLSVYNLQALNSVLDSAGLSGLKATLKGAEALNVLRETRRELGEALGWTPQLEEVKRALRLRRGEIREIMLILDDVKRRIPGIKALEAAWRRIDRLLENLTETEAEAAYLSTLIAQRLREDPGTRASHSLCRR